MMTSATTSRAHLISCAERDGGVGELAVEGWWAVVLTVSPFSRPPGMLDSAGFGFLANCAPLAPAVIVGWPSLVEVYVRI